MITVMLDSTAFAQANAGRSPRPVFWVATTAWPDGGEVPMKYAASQVMAERHQPSPQKELSVDFRRANQIYREAGEVYDTPFSDGSWI